MGREELPVVVKACVDFNDLAMFRLSLKLFLLLTFVWCFLNGYSQNEARKSADIMDSLLVVIHKNQKDTHHVNALLTLIDITYEKNLDSAFAVAEQVQKLSNTISFSKGEAKGLEWLGYISGRQSKLADAFRYHRECLRVELVSKNSMGIANALNNIGMIHYRKADMDSTIHYFKASLAQEEKGNNLKGIAASLNNIGYIIKAQGKTDEAIQYYLRAIEIKEQIGDDVTTANSYNNLAVVYYGQGNIAKSLEYHHKALKMREAVGNLLVISNSYSNIATIYNQQEENEMAAAYYEKALAIQRETSDKKGEAMTLNNMGNLFSEQGDLDKSLAYHMKSMRVHQEIGNQKGIAYASVGIAQDFMDKKQYDDAKPYLDSAVVIAREINDADWEIRALNRLGQFYYVKEDYNQALKYGLEAYEKSMQIGFPINIQSSAAVVSKSYKKLGQFEKALAMYETQILMRDSISNEETKKASIRSQTQYEFDKEQLLKEQELKNAERAEKDAVQRRDNLQYSGIFVFVLLLFAVVFMSGRFHMTERVAEGLIFFTFLLFFEFCLVLSDPFIDDFTGGEPLYKLAINAALVAMIFPLHAFFEDTLKSRLVNR